MATSGLAPDTAFEHPIPPCATRTAAPGPPTPGWLLGTSYLSPRTKKGAEDLWELRNASVIGFSFFSFLLFFAMGCTEKENGQD